MLQISILKQDHERMVSNLNFSKDLKVGKICEDIAKQYFESLGHEFVCFNEVPKNFKEWDIKMRKGDEEYDAESKGDCFIKPERFEYSSVFNKKVTIPKVETGNIFIEKECRGEGSGIEKTKAGIWINTFYNINEIWTIETDKLRQLISQNNFKIAKECGDVGSHTVGILIPRFEFIDWFTVVPFEKVIYEYQPQGVIG